MSVIWNGTMVLVQIFYELLIGRRPFRHNPAAAMQKADPAADSFASELQPSLRRTSAE